MLKKIQLNSKVIIEVLKLFVCVWPCIWTTLHAVVLLFILPTTLLLMCSQQQKEEELQYHDWVRKSGLPFFSMFESWFAWILWVLAFQWNNENFVQNNGEQLIQYHTDHTGLNGAFFYYNDLSKSKNLSLLS